jgi:hypothetical protein
LLLRRRLLSFGAVARLDFGPAVWMEDKAESVIKSRLFCQIFADPPIRQNAQNG